MSKPSFFVDKECKTDNIIRITGDENHHLFDVLVLRAGEKIEIMLNDGYVHTCVLRECGRRESLAEIESSEAVPEGAKITLFMALIKAERMDWAVQKVTELGVSRIVPFESEYCVVKDKGNKTDRLNRIAVSAAKQSGRASLPEICSTRKFSEVLASLSQFKQIVLAYEGAVQNARAVIDELRADEPIALIVGSEGGFSPREVEAFAASGAKVVSMGRNILRAETASVALLGAVNYSLGLWERKK